jgi:hypothetical protein
VCPPRFWIRAWKTSRASSGPCQAGVCFHHRCPCETPRHSAFSANSAANGSGSPRLSASVAPRSSSITSVLRSGAGRLGRVYRRSSSKYRFQSSTRGACGCKFEVNPPVPIRRGARKGALSVISVGRACLESVARCSPVLPPEDLDWPRALLVAVQPRSAEDVGKRPQRARLRAPRH